MREIVSNTNSYNQTKGYEKILGTKNSSLSLKPNVIKLLIVDDYAVVREGIVSLLGEVKDIEVVGQCGDTRSGIYMIEKLEPDVIMADISMPGTSPFELARRAKILHSSSRVIFFIKEITDNNIAQGLDCGACAFVTKTEPIEGIVSAIRETYAGKKYFSKEVKSRIIARHSYDPQLGSYTPRRSLLSPREIEVLCCVARGMNAKTIGKTLHITAKTVERHKSNIMAKLGLHSQVDLAIYAIKEGYVKP